MRTRHKRKKALSFGVAVRAVVQVHRQFADWAREAVRHLLNPMDWLVLKPCCENRSFIDARSSVFSRERMRAVFELPIQNVIKTVHGGRPDGLTPTHPNWASTSLHVNGAEEGFPRQGRRVVIDATAGVLAARLHLEHGKP